MLASLSLLGASIGIVAIAPNPVLAAVLLTVAEVTGQASGAICWATAADISSEEIAAQVGGILNLAAGLGGIIAPAATGFLLSATGSFYWPLLVAAVVMVASAFSYTFILGKVEPIKVRF
jgi:ACS family glucarate transporter-like MFS transporter